MGVDRRFKEARGFNDRQARFSEKVAASAKARARQFAASAKAYGGSTGGRKSLDYNAGIVNLNRRAAAQRKKDALFEDVGNDLFEPKRDFPYGVKDPDLNDPENWG